MESGHGQAVSRSVVLNSVAVIGAGNWGTALACAVARVGAERGLVLREVVVRDPVAGRAVCKHLQSKQNPRLVVDWDEARLDAEFLWICVPDDAIKSVCSQLVARRRSQLGAGKSGLAQVRAGQSSRVLFGQIVLHASGACESALLAEAQKAGAQIASVHPVMSFPRREPVSLDGLLYGVETASTGCRRRLSGLLRKLGGEPFSVATGSKYLYHAAGTLASPLLLSTFAAAIEAAQLAGLGKAQAARVVGRLAAATLFNAQSKGVATSLSGPLARGDAGTIGLHLQALREHPPLEEVYRALTAYALEHLPVRRAKEIAERLEETIKSRQPQKRQRSESPLTRKKRR